MSGKKKSEEDVEKSQDMTVSSLEAASERIDELEKELKEMKDGSVAKELAQSVLLEASKSVQQMVEQAKLMVEKGSALDLKISELLAQVLKSKIVGLSASKFPIWKTMQLGNHKDAESLRKAIVGKKNRISDWGNDILKRISVSPKETKIDLVKLTVAELGLSQGGTREQIYEKAKEMGLDLCPAEVGPQLRLQYQDQPYEEWILIGMEPITDSDGSPYVFSVGQRSGDRWLGADYGGAGGFWSPGCVWVFGRRK